MRDIMQERPPTPTAQRSTPTSRSRKGFAGMSAERRREIAASGGRIAQARGKAHRWTVEEARAMGVRAAQVRWGKVRSA